MIALKHCFKWDGRPKAKVGISRIVDNCTNSLDSNLRVMVMTLTMYKIGHTNVLQNVIADTLIRIRTPRDSHI